MKGSIDSERVWHGLNYECTKQNSKLVIHWGLMDPTVCLCFLSRTSHLETDDQIVQNDSAVRL
jgi:hypothetical protein